MINNARDKKINEICTNLPNMSSTIISWFQNLNFEYISRYIDDNGIWHNNEPTVINTMGVVQPPRPDELKILPEGTWNWEWEVLHCLPDLILKNDDYITYNDNKYKVMQVLPWQKYGYRKYVLLEAFKADTL